MQWKISIISKTVSGRLEPPSGPKFAHHWIRWRLFSKILVSTSSITENVVHLTPCCLPTSYPRIPECPLEPSVWNKARFSAEWAKSATMAGPDDKHQMKKKPESPSVERTKGLRCCGPLYYGAAPSAPGGSACLLIYQFYRPVIADCKNWKHGEALITLITSQFTSLLAISAAKYFPFQTVDANLSSV